MAVNLFDANFYRAANNDLAGLNNEQAISHFQTFGINEGREFSPFVNLNFYRATNSDLRNFNNQQLFEHLQNNGVAEARRFSPLVDLNFYRANNNDLRGLNNEQLFEHLRNNGIREDRVFSQFADLGFYRDSNSDLASLSNQQLLEHLEIFGVNEQRRFSQFADLGFYRANNSDLANLSNQQLLEHLEIFGINEQRRFSQFTDLEFYRTNNSDLASLNNQQLLEHLQAFGLREQREFSPFIDLGFYRASNSDLAGLSEQGLLQHLEIFGIGEGRQFSIVTDINFYRASNSDLASLSNSTAFEHLQIFGIEEGRRLSQFVDLNFYRSIKNDLQGANRQQTLDEFVRNVNRYKGRNPNFKAQDFTSQGISEINTRELEDFLNAFIAEEIQQAANQELFRQPSAIVGSIVAGQTSAVGELSSNDLNNSLRLGSFSDDYRLDGIAPGEQMQINLASTAFDTYLELLDGSTGRIIAFNDDSGGNRNSRLDFTVQEGISYVVRATSFSAGATGGYSLFTSPAPGATNAITGRQTVSGSLSNSDPTNPTRTDRFRDDYSLTDVSVGQAVQISLTSEAFDAYLQLINADTGEAIAFDDDSGEGPDSQLDFTVESGISYIIRTTSFSAGVTGDYTLATSSPTTVPITSIAVGQTINSNLTPNDQANPTRSGALRDDYLLASISAGQQIRLNMNAGFDSYLQLVNADTGELIAFDDDSGEGVNSQVDFTVQSGINYIVRATSYSADATGDYALSANSSVGTGAAIAPNQTVNGSLTNSDLTNPTRSGAFRDDYTLTGVSAGQQVQVNMTGGFDTFLQVVNAATGEVVDENDDSGDGTNSQLSFTVGSGINYIIRATSYSTNTNGDYSLTTTTTGGGGGGGGGTTGAITGNQSITGALSNSDLANPTRSNAFRDDYTLTGVSAGQEVQVNMAGGFDTFLQVVNAATGEVINFDDDSGDGTNSRLSFTVEAGINYIVRATSFSNATGDYTLTTATSGGGGGTPAPGSITGSQTLTGVLSNSDPDNPIRTGRFRDDYTLTGVSAGQQIQVNMNAAFDTFLQLVNAATGEAIAFNDDGGGSTNSQLNFTVEAGINYIIRATSFNANATGDYTLITSQSTPTPGFDNRFGYGLVNAAAAVASAINAANPFPDVSDLGGNAFGADLVRAPEVWAQGFTGQNVLVAVVDSGVDYNHTDLSANIWTNDDVAGNGIDDDNNGFIDDTRGWDFVNNDNTPLDLNRHGTHVSGTIAAINNGASTPTGIAYNATIMPVQVLSESGSGSNVGVAQGIRYAASNGARVINLSLGGGFNPDVEAAVNFAVGLGAVVVMASGNETANQPGFPARQATTVGLAVGALDINRREANFSNRAGNTTLDYVMAPGVNIFSTLPNNTFGNLNGTSMAAPHVAGVVALMLSANPNLTPAQVESILIATASNAGLTART